MIWSKITSVENLNHHYSICLFPLCSRPSGLLFTSSNYFPPSLLPQGLCGCYFCCWKDSSCFLLTPTQNSSSSFHVIEIGRIHKDFLDPLDEVRSEVCWYLLNFSLWFSLKGCLKVEDHLKWSKTPWVQRWKIRPVFCKVLQLNCLWIWDKAICSFTFYPTLFPPASLSFIIS